MRAKVTKAFPGVEDGKIYPRDIAIGEIISGDLAREAIGAELAEPLDEAKEAAAAKRKATEDARAAELAAQQEVAKKIEALTAIAAGARVDVSKAKTVEEFEAALKAAGVTIPA